MIVWVLIKAFFSGALKIAIAVGKFLMGHPKILCLVIGIVTGFAGGWVYKMHDAQVEVNKMQRVLKDAVAEAEKEAQGIKADSEERQKELEVKIDELLIELSESTASYEEQIADLKADQKIKIVKVKVPVENGSPKDIEIAFENGKHVCRTFPSVFKDKMNDAMKKTEETMKWER